MSSNFNCSYMTMSRLTYVLGLKCDYPRTIPARFGLISFSGYREDLNVIFYQNLSNLHNWYKSVEKKISQKNPEYMLNYSLSYTACRVRYSKKSPWSVFFRGEMSVICHKITVKCR